MSDAIATISQIVSRQLPNQVRDFGIEGGQFRSPALFVIGVFETGGHRRAQEGEVDARLQPRALPYLRRNDHLRVLAGQDVGTQNDLAAALQEKAEASGPALRDRGEKPLRSAAGASRKMSRLSEDSRSQSPASGPTG